MTRRLLLLLIAWHAVFAKDYRVALPGYQYEFPRDYFNHPDFQTEWWYYTGNLESANGRRFGFELTFFRQATQRPPRRESVWQVDDVWLAHLALSDINGQRFFHTERLNRAGAGLAGADLQQGRLWNGNWEVRWDGTGQRLQAVADNFTLTLAMAAAKPPVIHGRNGVSQKAEGRGRASHYISFPRLRVDGTLALDGKTHVLRGTAWMDHEFFTHQLEGHQSGWDWFSIQLEDNTELMLFRLRRKDGTVDPYSSGTYVDAQGRARRLDAKEFTLTPGATWKSDKTAGNYPVEWSISVPSLAFRLDARTSLRNQELTGKSKLSPAYWEGAVDFTGMRGDSPVKGRGYLEMTGYDKPVTLWEAR